MIRLRTIESEMEGSREMLSSFFNRVNAWQRPIVREAEYPWFLSFELHEPDEESEDSEWRVRYQLEPVHGGPALPVEKAPPRYAARLLAPGRHDLRQYPRGRRFFSTSMSREPFVFSPRPTMQKFEGILHSRTCKSPTLTRRHGSYAKH